MNEPMWVAIVGILGTIVGTVLGALLTYVNTKAQIKARTNELQQQFGHERTERQIARLIKIRASYLNPISEHLQSITESSHLIESKIRDLIVRCCGDDDVIAWAYPESKSYLKDMTSSVKSISESMDGIEMLRVKNTDNQFAGLINNTLSLGNQVSIDISKLSGLRIKHGEGDISKTPNKEIGNQCVHALDLINNLFKIIRESNHRIEEILSGME